MEDIKAKLETGKLPDFISAINEYIKLIGLNTYVDLGTIVNGLNWAINQYQGEPEIDEFFKHVSTIDMFRIIMLSRSNSIDSIKQEVKDFIRDNYLRNNKILFGALNSTLDTLINDCPF